MSVLSYSYLKPVKSDLLCILFTEEYRLPECGKLFGILFHPHGNRNVHLSAKLYERLFKALGIGGISVLRSDFSDLSHPVGNKEPTFKFQDSFLLKSLNCEILATILPFLNLKVNITHGKIWLFKVIVPYFITPSLRH